MPVADRSPSPDDVEGRLREAEVRLARLEERQVADREARAENKQFVAEKLGELNNLRRDVITDRGLLATNERLDAVHMALEAKVAAQDKIVDVLRAEVVDIRSAAAASRKANAQMLAVATLFLALVVAVANILT